MIRARDAGKKINALTRVTTERSDTRIEQSRTDDTRAHIYNTCILLLLREKSLACMTVCLLKVIRNDYTIVVIFKFLQNPTYKSNFLITVRL